MVSRGNRFPLGMVIYTINGFLQVEGEKYLPVPDETDRDLFFSGGKDLQIGKNQIY